MEDCGNWVNIPILYNVPTVRRFYSKRVSQLHVSFRFPVYRMGLGRRGGVEANVDPVQVSSIDVGVEP